MIFWNELKKYGKNRMSVLFFVVLLMVTGVSFYYFNYQFPFTPEQYRAAHKEVDGKSAQEVSAFCQQELEAYEFYSLYGIQEDGQAFLDSYAREHGQEWVNARISQYPKIDQTTINGHMKVMEQIQKECANVYGYEEYRQQIQEQYRTNQMISIFQSEDDYNEKAGQKMSRAYEELEVKGKMELKPTLGLEQTLKFSFRDVAGVLFLLYCVGIGILQEKKKGILSFLQVTYKGRKKLYLRKVAGLAVCVAMWEVCSFLLCLGIGQLQFGAMDVSMAVQSVGALVRSPYSMNIGMFLAGYVAFRVVIYVGISVLAAALAFVFGSFVGVVGACIALFGAGFGLYTNISEVSVWSFLKRCNLWQWLRAEDFLGNYIHIRLGEEPVSLYLGVWIFAVVCVFMYVVGKRSFVRQKERSVVRKAKTRRKSPHSILFYEMKKLWVQDFGLAIFAVVILVQLLLTFQTKPYQTMEDFYYNAYVDQIGNKVDVRSKERLEQEEQRFAVLQQQMSEETDEARRMYLESEMRPYQAFQTYSARFYEIEEQGDGQSLVKESQYRFLLDDEEQLQKTVLLLLCALVFVLPGICQREKETGTELLQQTARYGRERLWRAKLLAAASFVFPLTTLLFGSLVVRAYREFPDLDLFVALESVEKYRMSDMQISVAMYLGLVFAVRLLVVTAVFVVELWCAKRLKNRYNVMFVCAAVTVLPILVGNVISVRGVCFLQEAIQLLHVKSMSGFLWYGGISLLVSVFFYERGKRV